MLQKLLDLELGNRRSRSRSADCLIGHEHRRQKIFEDDQSQLQIGLVWFRGPKIRFGINRVRLYQLGTSERITWKHGTCLDFGFWERAVTDKGTPLGCCLRGGGDLKTIWYNLFVYTSYTWSKGLINPKIALELTVDKSRTRLVTWLWISSTWRIPVLVLYKIYVWMNFHLVSGQRYRLSGSF